MKSRHLAAFAALLLSFSGCVTIQNTVSSVRPDYTTLPEETVREVAHEIETAIHQGNRDAEIADRGGIVISTPAMQQAIRTRAARNELIAQARTEGWGREQEDGLISIERDRDYNKGRNRRQKNRDAGLIIGENNDRWALYEGIRKESGLPPRSLSAIQHIFADVRAEIIPADQLPAAKEPAPES